MAWKAGQCNKTSIPSSALDGWPTKAKEAPSPHEVRLTLLEKIQLRLGRRMEKFIWNIQCIAIWFHHFVAYYILKHLLNCIKLLLRNYFFCNPANIWDFEEEAQKSRNPEKSRKESSLIKQRRESHKECEPKVY